MAQILVKTPLTTNGRDPLIGADGRQVFREDILTAFAGGLIEKANAKLPQHLRKIVTPVTAEAATAKPANYGPWGLKKLQGELEERGLPYSEDLEKPDLITILKNHDEASA